MIHAPQLSRTFCRSIVATIAALLLLASPECLSAQSRVVLVAIEGDVDEGLGSYVERAVEQLDEEDILVYRVHTFGGRVDVATRIRDAILDVPGRTIAYVDKRAISAGALIALAADELVMSPGSSMGAVTPVDGSGTKGSEKVVSYMRSEMRGTAERKGRDPAVAEAMVDEEIDAGEELDAGPGRLLTLTANEAISIGFADTLAGSLEELLEIYDLSDRPVETIGMSEGEELVRFLSSPVVASILMMLGLGGLFYAIKSGSIGPIAIVGVAALALFFGGHYLAGLSGLLEIVLFAGGILLLIVEVFVVPGFGFPGIAGLLAITAGLFLSLIDESNLGSSDAMSVPLLTLAGAFVGFFVIAWAMYRFLPNSSRFRRLALFGESLSGGAARGIASEADVSLVGERGTVIAALRPAGVAEFDGVRHDVVSSSGLVRAGATVEVLRFDAGRPVVREIPGTTSSDGDS